MTLRQALVAVSLLVGIVVPMSASYAATYDVLELPATVSEMADKSPIFAIRKFGDRYFAVGQRGHILYSDNGGDSWTQAAVPVRSTLLDIHFPTAELGWAVGHEGVILHSEDGGKNWVKQYDGLRYATEGKAFYNKLAEEYPDNEYYPYYAKEMIFAASQGADRPLFKVYFHTPEFGHAVGAYGMALVTRDGGKTWQHVLHTIENDSLFHIYDFAPLPGEGQFFLCGEAGLLLKVDLASNSSVRVHSIPWEGSFFTCTSSSKGAVVVGGLRGRMFLTEDMGDSWTIVKKPPTSSLVDSVRLANGNLVFLGIAGEILLSVDEGYSFSKLPIGGNGRLYTVAEGPAGTLLVGGPGGIKKLDLP